MSIAAFINLFESDKVVIGNLDPYYQNHYKVTDDPSDNHEDLRLDWGLRWRYIPGDDTLLYWRPGPDEPEIRNIDEKLRQVASFLGHLATRGVIPPGQPTQFKMFNPPGVEYYERLPGYARMHLRSPDFYQGREGD